MRIWGHPVHPMLVHFPIALWTIAVAAYIADISEMFESAATVAKFANGAGLIMAILAMLPGILELRTIGIRSEAMQVATWHMMIMMTAWICFLLAFLLPISAGPVMSHPAARLAATACASAGFLLMALGGWLGGRLVYKFGVAVEDRIKS